MREAFSLTPAELLEIRVEMVRRGLVQKQVASEMGVSYATLNGRLTGRAPWNKLVAVAFKAVTGIEVTIPTVALGDVDVA